MSFFSAVVSVSMELFLTPPTSNTLYLVQVLNCPVLFSCFFSVLSRFRVLAPSWSNTKHAISGTSQCQGCSLTFLKVIKMCCLPSLNYFLEIASTNWKTDLGGVKWEQHSNSIKPSPHITRKCLINFQRSKQGGRVYSGSLMFLLLI